MATRGLGTILKMGKDTAANAVAGLTEIGGFKDAGEVSLSGFFNPSTGQGQKELYDAFESGDAQDFTIEFPKKLKTKWLFKGVVTGFSTNTSLEDPVGFESTIKVSGKPTLAVTA